MPIDVSTKINSLIAMTIKKSFRMTQHSMVLKVHGFRLPFLPPSPPNQHACPSLPASLHLRKALIHERLYDNAIDSENPIYKTL